MRRGVWVVLVVLLLSAAGLATLIWRDAVSARAALVEARGALRDGERLLTDEQAPYRAAEAFERARTAADRGGQHLDGPGWSLLSTMPRLGDTVRLTRSATDLARAGADLGQAVAEQAGPLLDGGALEGLFVDGAVDLDRLRSLAGTIDQLPTAPLASARDRLAGIEPTDVLGSLRDDREEAVDLASGVLDRVARASAGLHATITFLGGDGPRTYVVAAQNPSELRGTGGLIGFVTEMSVEGGVISLSGGESFDADEALTQRTQVESTRHLPEPVARPDAFADRYDHNAGGQFMGSVNLDPDLPTVGPVLLDLHARELGRDADGVILVDPVALGRLVTASGRPLELPVALETAGLPHRVPGARIADLVMVEGYEAFDGGGPGKKAFDRAMIVAGLQRVMSGGWEAVPMARAVGDVFATRHMQLFSRDEAVQQAFERLDLAGQVAHVDGPGDLLAVTANNAGPNKTDVHVAHRITAQLDLSLPTGAGADRLARRAQVEVAVENPLSPSDFNEYVAGSSEPVPIGSGVQPRRHDALNRTWFTVWTPPLTQLNALRDGVHDRPLRADDIHGHRAIDYFLETPAQSTNAFSIDVSGDVTLRRDGDAWVYELELWRQAKAIPDHWDVQVTAPDGWTVADAAVAGGGAPTGMGIGGDGASPLAATVDGNAVTARGAVTRDATLTVRLQRS